ncbi:MAG: HD-GYP domain-containing protein [Armatimonadota bacterium]
MRGKLTVDRSQSAETAADRRGQAISRKPSTVNWKLPLLSCYIGLTIAAGVVAFGWSLRQWGQVELELWELALFIGLAGILDAMVVPVAGVGGMAASFAVFFAGLLTLGGGPTAWLAALAVLWADGLLRRKPLARAGFNASHSVLSLLAVGWLYERLGGEPGRLVLNQWQPLLAVVGAAAALWLVETAWVSVAMALEKGGALWRRLGWALGPGLAWDGALASSGVLLALLYQSRGQLAGQANWPGALFLGATVLIPCGLLYYAYRLQSSLQQVYSQSLRTLGALLEAKVEGSRPGNGEQGGHGEQVASLAARIAERLQLPAPQVEQIRYAGYLHDIGKVGVPSSLLSRGRDQYAGEAEAVRLHATIGAGILAPVRFLGPAAEIVKAHHERWDGLGYPAGLRGKQIPLGARVLALANAYVGMTYSPNQSLTPTQALSRLRKAAGARFDPEIAALLAKVLQASGDAAPEEASGLEFAAD